MRWHEFVFSNQPRHRNRRHLVCWLLWWLYIVFTIFFTREISPGSGVGLYHHQSGLNELGYLSYSLLVIIKSFLLLLTHLFFCYAVIYFLLPNYLSKKKYWPLVTGVLVTCILMIPMGYFLYSLVYPYIDDLFSLHLPEQNKTIVYSSIDAGLVNAIRVTLVAAAITLLKRWWVKQKEKESLEKEKINTELQLLKAQVHPTFLFNTLNNIISHARMASTKAPEMLIKLSDLLSYMLYECDAPKVKLEKEIGLIKEYMALEKIRQGERLELTFQIKGNLNGQLISPLLLLPFIDNSFSYCDNKAMEHAWVNLDITIEEDRLFMKLINGTPAGTQDDIQNNEQALANVQKRLQLLYPGRHELRINTGQELLMIYLNLNLEETAQEEPTTIEIIKPSLIHA
jgi:sensor histidine kinase YesM